MAIFKTIYVGIEMGGEKVKNFAFISDFDGTLTDKDFYKIVMDEYLKDECKTMYDDWKAKKMKDIEYLGYVFRNIRRKEEEINQDIMKIPLDPFIVQFANYVKAVGGEFIVVSAGSAYYIEKVFEKHGIEGVKIYSNKGVFKDNGIHFVLDETSEFYSPIYGINKSKVVSKLKEKYDKVFYAGDSEPDLKAAMLADVIFARGSLVELLEKENKEFIEFKNFTEVWICVKRYLEEWNL